jgi:uncharacterized protein YjaZ
MNIRLTVFHYTRNRVLLQVFLSEMFIDFYNRKYYNKNMDKREKIKTYDSKEIQSSEEILMLLSKWEQEVRQLLPTLPQFNTVFNNTWLIPDTGTGGFARSKDQIELAFDLHFLDKDRQLDDLKGSLFHECYHLVQGFVSDDYSYDKVTALDNAIYEGAATVFEKVHTKSQPKWGEYPERPKALEWLELIRNLGTDVNYSKWKFYHPELDERWILYRTGSFIIDEALNNNDVKIENLATMPPSDIFRLSRL